MQSCDYFSGGDEQEDTHQHQGQYGFTDELMNLKSIGGTELRMADDMERRMRLTVRSGGRGDALDALPHHSTENTQRSLALTSPIPQLRGRRAWIPVARREGESAALTSGPRPGVTRA